MNEVRFMIYDRKRKLIIFPDSLILDCVGNYRHGFGDSVESPRYSKLFQYIGKVDKNGVEIYEGSICNVNIKSPSGAIIKQHRGVVVYSVKHSSFMFKIKDWPLVSLCGIECEVVGHIASAQV